MTSLKLQGMAIGAAVLASLSFGSGVWVCGAFCKADRVKSLEAQNHALKTQSRAAVQVTLDLDKLVANAADHWAASWANLRLEIQPVKIETREIVRNVATLEDADGCFDALLPVGVCELEARAAGRDPDLSCPAGAVNGGLVGARPGGDAG